MRRFHTVVVAVVAAFALLGAVSAPAEARTFSNSSSGSDYERTTTLNYATAHGTFNLRAWVTVDSCCFISGKYTIKMYNKAGGLLWSATNQGDRTYSIGGNVTKIVLTRNSTYGATTKWQRK